MSEEKPRAYVTAEFYSRVRDAYISILEMDDAAPEEDAIIGEQVKSVLQGIRDLSAEVGVLKKEQEAENE